MENKIRAAFGAVRAEESLKSSAKAYIAGKTRGCSRKRVRIAITTFGCVCAAVLACVLVFTPTVRVDIDINPSLELGINRFDRVVSVKGLNDDGKLLAKSLDIGFDSCGEALSEILSDKSVAALLSDNGDMSVTVIKSNPDQTERILSEFRHCAEGSYVHCNSASSEEARAAREHGLSCGKYHAFLKLQELDPDITPQDIQDMPMWEIRALIASLSGDDTVSTGGGGHHGNGHGCRHASENGTDES